MNATVSVTATALGNTGNTTMGKRFSVRTAAALAAVWMLVGVATQAATFTWNTGVAGNWSAPGSWSGGAVPPYDATADVILDGETSTASTAYGDAHINVKSLTIADGDTYSMNAYISRAWSIASGGLQNAGTISVTGAGGGGQIRMGISGANVNSGIIEVVNANRFIYIGYGNPFTLDNTDGIIRATSGGTLLARSGGDNPITGGQFIVGADSFADHVSWNDGFTLNNVAASNAGTYKVNLESATGGYRFGKLTGTTVFANSGTLDIRNESTHATANIEAYFTVGGSASLTSTGASQINIVQNSTSGGTGHNAYLQLDASATAFVNDGAVAITSVAGSQGTAQLRSSRPLINTGTITVDGPQSSIQMAGQTLTQSGGTLTVKNGGSVVAGTVAVNGGTITGDGTVTANTVIQGTHSPGNSPGVQDFTGNLTYSGGSSQVTWELIANDTATRGVQFDGIDVSGNLDFAAATALNLVFDLAGSAVDWSDALWSAEHLGTAGWLVYEVDGDSSGTGNLTVAGLDWQDGQGDWLGTVQPKGSFDLFLDGDTGNVYLNYALIPEPASAAIFCLAGLALLRRRR